VLLGKAALSHRLSQVDVIRATPFGVAIVRRFNAMIVMESAAMIVTVSALKVETKVASHTGNRPKRKKRRSRPCIRILRPKPRGNHKRVGTTNCWANAEMIFIAN
jgi:hypothetical protein